MASGGIDTLHLTWSEKGGPPASAPERKGFGSRLIEQAITRELDGQLQIEFAPEGLRCRLALPLRNNLEQVA
jgi:two-component sensor histidine kinase